MRHRQPELLGGLEVDHQLEFGRLLHRQIGRLRTVEDLCRVDAELAIGVYQVWAVAYQTAGISKLAEPSDRRNAIVPFQRHQLFTLGHEQYASPSINASA